MEGNLLGERDKLRGAAHKVGDVADAACPQQLVAVGNGVAHVARVVGVGTHGDHLAAQLVEGGENLCVVGGRAGVVQAGVDFDAPTGLDGAAENLPDDVLVPVQADGLVIGAPVHYASPAGAMLSFLDRMFFAGSKNFAHKPGACVTSARRAGTTASLDVLSKYLTISQMPLVSAHYWPMVHGGSPEEVRQDAEGMQVMRRLGDNMAWLLRCIEAAKEKGIEPPAPEKRVWTNFIR